MATAKTTTEPAAVVPATPGDPAAAAAAQAVPTATAPDAPASGRRVMPEHLRRHLIRVTGGQYLPAAYRLVWFREECPDWSIITEMIEGGQEAGYATVRATVMNRDGRIIATGTKTETRQDFPAGWVEKAETGAVSRALAFAGFGTQFAPEMVDEPSTNPRTTAHGAAVAVWAGPGQCPRCHAPEGKPHGAKCTG